MSQIDWTDVLDIGLPKLDEQHRKLISFSNSLIQAMTIGMGKEVLDDLFTELLDYTSYHFSDEEEYMERIGYPHLEAHKVEHRKLIQKVTEFRIKLIPEPSVSPSEALDFINGWIINHIMEMDSQIGVFAKTGK